jgi:hypothetical protein
MLPNVTKHYRKSNFSLEFIADRSVVRRELPGFAGHPDGSGAATSAAEGRSASVPTRFGLASRFVVVCIRSFLFIGPRIAHILAEPVVGKEMGLGLVFRYAQGDEVTRNKPKRRASCYSKKMFKKVLTRILNTKVWRRILPVSRDKRTQLN